MSRSNRRWWRKLAKPSLQLRLIGTFVGLSALALLSQVVLLALRLVQLTNELAIGGDLVREQLPGLVVSVLATSFGVLLPLTIGFGILVTFRTAGPIYRFERHMEALARGEDPGPCRIRDRDELQELCDHINEAVARVRADAARAASGEAAESPLRRAS